MRIKKSTYRSIERHAPVVGAVSAVVMVTAMFLGWFRSGSRMRNSFEMFRIPQQLGLDGFATIRLVWFLVPVLAAGVVGFSVLRRPRWAGLLGAVQALVGASVALVVLFSDLDTGFGPALTLATALSLLAAAFGMALTSGSPS